MATRAGQRVIALEEHYIDPEQILERPDRFAGFASLPTMDPGASADELDGAVRQSLLA